MSKAENTTSQPKDANAIVDAAIDTIIAAYGWKPSLKKQIREFVDGLVITKQPKLDYVSFYAADTKRGVNYRVTFTLPGYPRKTLRLGRVEKYAYQRARQISEIISQVKGGVLRPEEAHRSLFVDNTPIAQHVEAFRKHLASHGSVERYVNNAITRLNRCVELMGIARISQIRRPLLAPLVEKLKTTINPQTQRPLHSSTINDYLAVLRQFTKWATPTLLRDDPLLNSSGIKNTDKLRRRDVLPEELALIVAMAEQGRGDWAMSGPDRAMLYLAAYATGLRRSELESLQVSWVKLDANPPYIAVPANVTKTGKAADQPLPTWLADQMRTWLGGRRTGLLWPTFNKDSNEMFQRDREEARAAWIDAAKTPEEQRRRETSPFLRRRTSDGVIVFHSLRHSYASQLMRVLDPKSAQILTRHATLTMLLDTYAHGRLTEAAKGVNQAIKDPLIDPKQALAQSAAHSR